MAFHETQHYPGRYYQGPGIIDLTAGRSYQKYRMEYFENIVQG
jgi:hypothetical protein